MANVRHNADIIFRRTHRKIRASHASDFGEKEVMTQSRQGVNGDTEIRIPIARAGVANKPQECEPERSASSQGDLMTWPWAGS